MAVDTLEVIAPHVHIEIFAGVEQAFVEITVLDGVATATAEVTSTTVLPGRQANTFRGSQQIHAFRG